MEIKLEKLDAVVFDMDGVIFDTERLALRSWQVVADRNGLGDVTETANKCIGRNTADTMKIFEEAYGSRVSIAELYEQGKQVMQNIIKTEGLPLKEGVAELLGFLKEQGIKIGLASSTKQSVVREELTQAGLVDYFSVIVGGDMIEHSKPEPDIYLLACEKLCAEPKRAACIEDSFNGVISGHRAGLGVIMVPDLLEPDEDILALVDVYKKSLTEVRDYLGGRES